MFGDLGKNLSPYVPAMYARISAMASADKLVASVRMYVISPASYNFCAAVMVRRDEKYNLRAASCCRVLVVNGAAARRDVFFFSMAATWAAIGTAIRDTIPSIWVRDAMVIFSIFCPSNCDNMALNADVSFSHPAVSDQYSTGLNASISRSRSTTSFTATDCTRPADFPKLRSHSNGEIPNPIR